MIKKIKDLFSYRRKLITATIWLTLEILGGYVGFLPIFSPNAASQNNYNFNIGGLDFRSGSSLPTSCPRDGSKFWLNGGSGSQEGWYTCINGTLQPDLTSAPASLGVIIATDPPFNADPTGATDAGTPIANACNSSASQKTVILPLGTYAYKLAAPAIANPCTLMGGFGGTGDRKAKLQRGYSGNSQFTANAPALLQITSSNVTIQNLEIDGQNAGDGPIRKNGSNGVSNNLSTTFTDATFNAFVNADAGFTLAYVCNGYTYYSNIQLPITSSTLTISAATCSGTVEAWQMYFGGDGISLLGNITDLKIDNVYMHNNDGPSIFINATTATCSNPLANSACQGPQRVLIQKSRIIGGPAGESIKASQSASDIQIVDNVLDSSADFVFGHATINMPSGGLTTVLSNIDIERNKIVCASNSTQVPGAGWCVQIAGANAYASFGLKVVNNQMEILNATTQGFVSVSQVNPVISGNTMNNHYVDLMQQFTDGDNTHGAGDFRSASLSCSTPTFGQSNCIGRTIVCNTCGAGGTVPVQAQITAVVSATDVTTNAGAWPNTGTGLTWQLMGWGHTFTGIEATATTGGTISGNTINTETAVQTSCIEIDSSNATAVVGNHCHGFGELNGSFGIGIFATNANQTIGTLTETGNIVTVTVATPPLSASFQPGESVAICTTTPTCTPSTFYGVYQIINNNYNRINGTFSYIDPLVANQATCNAACGSVQIAVTGDNIVGNTIAMPQAGSLTASVYGLRVQGPANTYIYNETFANNNIQGTNNASNFEIGIGANGATADSITFAGNTISYVGVGINRNNGTHLNFLKNAIYNVNNYSSGVAQATEHWEFPQSFTMQVTGADVTCGTGGTLTPCTALTTITGMTTTLPFVGGLNWSISCDITLSQATAGAADQIGIQTTGQGFTNTTIAAIAYTNTGVAPTTGSITDSAAATTYKSLITFTPTLAAVVPVHFAGTLEGSSTTGASTINIGILTGSGADLITVQRSGTQCVLTPTP